MSQPGFGVMINMLFGCRDFTPAQQAIGKAIASVSLERSDYGPDYLLFRMADGTAFQLWDARQSCCEHRYMHTDDDLPYHVGALLVDIELRDGPGVERDYGETESQFLIVTTSKGCFTVVNYNEHNGYYGGFHMDCKAVD